MATAAPINPYANLAHRKGCGCLQCGFVPEPDRAVACRRCAFWKRRDPAKGSCWHPTHEGRETFQGASCRHFEPRSVFVRTPATPEQVAADLGQAFDFEVRP